MILKALSPPPSSNTSVPACSENSGNDLQDDRFINAMLQAAQRCKHSEAPHPPGSLYGSVCCKVLLIPTRRTKKKSWERKSMSRTLERPVVACGRTITGASIKTPRRGQRMVLSHRWLGLQRTSQSEQRLLA